MRGRAGFAASVPVLQSDMRPAADAPSFQGDHALIERRKVGGEGPGLDVVEAQGAAHVIFCVEVSLQLDEQHGIVPALESAHAVAFARKLARKMPRRAWILVNLSGRGDKDLEEYARLRGLAP